MRIADHIHLVGSGAIGLSHPGDCHIYLIDGGSELALVDAGCGEGVRWLLDNVAASGFDPRKIRYLLLTHAHRDHAGGCLELKRILGAMKQPSDGAELCVAASEPEARLLSGGTTEELGLDLLGLGDRPREQVFPPCDVDTIVQDGDALRIGNLNLTVIEVPGHNPGCVCYLLAVDGQRALFSGDVIYQGGVIGLGNWPGSDLHAYKRGLRKLAALDVDMLLPGHLLWTVRNGQAHIDKALRSFEGLWPPPNINSVP